MTKLNKGRVVSNHLTKYIVEYNNDKYSLEVSGRFKYMSYSKSDYPVVGDYVFFRETNHNEGIIESIEERKNTLSRLGTVNVFNEQIIASNIDKVFICVSLNQDYHIRKVLNFISMTQSYDYERVLLFTKSDLTDEYEPYVNEVKEYIDIDIKILSSFNVEDIKELKEYIGLDTCVFIGSSGVGKSTIINKLIGDEHFETSDIRISDAQGRHTTVHKELITLDTGGAIIDSPGIRVVQSYMVDNVEEEFKDIFNIASECRFRDCSHDLEPGCMIRESLEIGDLLEERYNQYTKAIKLNAYVKRQERQKELLQNKRKK